MMMIYMMLYKEVYIPFEIKKERNTGKVVN